MTNVLTARPLRLETPLTQYGRTDKTGFRVRPRPVAEKGISLIAGQLTARQARRLVVRRGIYRPSVDAVRHTTVSDLSDADFTVRPDPTPAIPDHVLVTYDGEWDDEVAERFNACFGPTVTEEDIDV